MDELNSLLTWIAKNEPSQDSEQREHFMRFNLSPELRHAWYAGYACAQLDIITKGQEIIRKESH